MPDDAVLDQKRKPRRTSAPSKPRRYQTKNRLRFVTAAALFDGHDAAINIMRRILQAAGSEVIHLGHNRSVEQVVTAAVQEDVHGIALSSYQGGHVEYFKYMIDLLGQRGAGHIKVFGGGGGVIVPEEISELHDYGVTRIYAPEDGQAMGLTDMIDDMLKRADTEISKILPRDLKDLGGEHHQTLARVISAFEAGTLPAAMKTEIAARAAKSKAPVLGVTGTGGAGKSSLTDEIVQRFRLDHPELDIAIIAVDPSRKRTGGALLGDRIRMNAIDAGVYFRSLATRGSDKEIAEALPEAIAACKAAGADLVIAETSGIGQGDAGIVPFVDLSLYVMTPEFGAASQLEKIDMLDFADLVAINKFDRKGGEDALRDVRKQVQRNKESFGQALEALPVYGTIASRFNDDGVTALYCGILEELKNRRLVDWSSRLSAPRSRVSSKARAIIPGARSRYLAEIAETVRKYRQHAGAQATLVRERQQLLEAKRMLEGAGKKADALDALAAEKDADLDERSKSLIESWPKIVQSYSGEERVSRVRERDVKTKLTYRSLSGTSIPKVALPRYQDHGELLRFLLMENLPGRFPYTAGVFDFKRQGEDPTRMFAGEGDPKRTNKRFHYLSKDSVAKRLSTAFDSVTLYGWDPDERPDIYGKVGTSGVSIATLDDMKVLYSGFDLTDPTTSVSMTINGPAPSILAMFLNTAIDQNIDKFRDEKGHDPSGKEIDKIKAWTLSNARGTVQADILKEDQGQNTCIFSTEFSLKVMGDIQEYFVRHDVRNFYSVSISGYHIAEAGANPLSQLAFTLANGFTFVETYLARGMDIDDFAPNLSFFFSNGMDPEYAVLGRVARRIWATVMRDRYGASERSQKLKYHVQTSGRSLHAQEYDFNDIRTTLQALIAVYDNCNSLHTNAYDEAVTTPSAASVRRAMAIQLIINKEWGLARNENPNQGAFIIDELTYLVEEAVLQEFARISERGGVLGAMELGYQRGKIQDESLLYETEKHDGSLPIVGINTFLNPDPVAQKTTLELARGTEKEKRGQIDRLRAFHKRHAKEAPTMLERLQDAVRRDDNVFAVLMDAVRVCSLGQITHALFEVGGQYRRNM